ncbi:MAG: dipeptidase [Psychromonas sp.]|jgi:dipeptidase|uniref:C69 family dipeptidase n=1 Tax=Psychromonas sp. TaxID=1884585 RepID=UPI0039E2250F
MCTSIIAGKRATAGDLVLLSRNEDFPSNNCWNKYMVFRKEPEYANNSLAVNGLWTLGNGLLVPIPKTRYRYNATPDAQGYAEARMPIGDHYYFEERGINEKNVAISATNSLTINDKANEADPLLTEKGVAESIIPTLILPQVDNALHGVKLLGYYVETFGASEVNGVLFGDQNDAWYFEIGSAHHWIAVRVPEDKYLVIANGMRVHDIDLNDKENVLCSEGLFEFVVKNKLLAEPDSKRFNFAMAFGIPGDPYNTDRIWLAQKMLTPSKKQSSRKVQYPLFLQANKKITLADVMDVLRANYKDTELEGKAQRAIGVDYTAESHIITLDASMPEPLKGIIWQSISTPLGAPYMPFYSIMDDIPSSYTKGAINYEPDSSYWAFKGLFVLADSLKETKYKQSLEELWYEFEVQSLLEVQALNKTLKSLYLNDAHGAINLAKRYSTGIACQAIEMANEQRNAIMTDITATQVEPIPRS